MTDLRAIPDLVLASSSPYRKRQLGQLGINFKSLAPNVDESGLADEQPPGMALRLGRLKAEAVLSQLETANDCLVIGSDQVCHCDGTIYRKPGGLERAKQHLATFSGQTVVFSTSLVILAGNGDCFETVEDFRITFRVLSEQQITDYLLLDEPWDCAGAIKVEQAGISLLKDTSGRDINSLYGLPLMALVDGLEGMGCLLTDFK